MAVGTGAVKKLFTPQHILNTSYDPQTGLIGVQQVAYDPISGTGKVITTSTLGAFKTNNVAQPSAALVYTGAETEDGVWLVKSIDGTSELVFTYATQLNNPSVTSYADAWASRATLTYGQYSSAL